MNAGMFECDIAHAEHIFSKFALHPMHQPLWDLRPTPQSNLSPLPAPKPDYYTTHDNKAVCEAF